MTPSEFREVARQIQYKPGWKLDVADYMRDPFRALHIVGTAQVEDAYGGHPARVMHQQILSILDVEHFDEARAVSYFYRFFVEMERHETDEWFRYQGHRPYDPHKPAGKTYGRTA